MSGVGQVQKWPADHQVAHHGGYVCRGEALRSEKGFYKRPAHLLLCLRTFCNDAVHETHGEAEEDETVQVVHLQDRNVTK